MADEVCARCGSLGGDRRTLWMACFYAMHELGLPFSLLMHRGVWLKDTGKRDTWGFPSFEDPELAEDSQVQSGPAFYQMIVCKGCRSEWMEAIQTWFRATPGETVRWNNDQHDTPSALAALLAEYEELRTRSVALKQQIDDSCRALRKMV